MTTNRQCSGVTYGDLFAHHCRLLGSVEEDGKWWCEIHVPSAVALDQAFARKMRNDATRRRVQLAKELVALGFTSANSGGSSLRISLSDADAELLLARLREP